MEQLAVPVGNCHSHGMRPHVTSVMRDACRAKPVQWKVIVALQAAWAGIWYATLGTSIGACALQLLSFTLVGRRMYLAQVLVGGLGGLAVMKAVSAFTAWRFKSDSAA